MPEPSALFVTDLDGTLLDAQKAVPRRNLDALAAAERAGVAIAIVTGRRCSILEPDLAKLDGLSYRVGASNGAVILKPDNRSLERVYSMEWSLIDTLCAASELERVPLLAITAPAEDGHTELPDCLVLEAKTRRWLGSWTPRRRDTLIDVDERVCRARLLVHAALYFPDHTAASRAAVLASELLPADVSVHVVHMPYGDGALTELVPLGGKGLALEYLAERLGVPRERTAAVGDELNDCDLLDVAGHAYAVGGSPLSSGRPTARLVGAAADGAVADALGDFLSRIG